MLDNVKLPQSDVLDRYTIELRKQYYGHGNPQMVKELATELIAQLSAKSQNHLPENVFTMVHAAAMLGLLNDGIANSEWQIRAGRNLSLEEIGRRAVLTRRLNDSRSNAKQELSKAFEENVETRHFGYGDLDPETLTLEVQEPPEVPAMQFTALPIEHSASLFDVAKWCFTPE